MRKLFLFSAALFLYASALAEMSEEQWRGLDALLESHAAEGRFREAARIATTALPAVEGDRGPAHLWTVTLLALGDHHHRLGNLRAAESMYKKADEHEPDRTEAIVKLGQLYSLSGRSEEALILFQQALTRHPTGYWLSAELALTYASLGKREEAREILQRSSSPADRGEKDMLAALGYALLGRGDDAAAEDVFHRLLQTDKARGCHHMAQYFSDIGRFETAASHTGRHLRKLLAPRKSPEKRGLRS